jgi:hypothetical protein
MGFLHTIWKIKRQEMVGGVKEEQNERCAGSSCEIIDSTNTSSHLISEIVAYHKGKRIFLSSTDMEKNKYELQICEFIGQTGQTYPSCEQNLMSLNSSLPVYYLFS